MNEFCAVVPTELDNAIKAIGKDWMLITVRDEKNNKVNAMTASWGALGVLWNKNICICFVRPQRYTYELLKENDEFSIAFLSEEHRDALKLCGRVSGREHDKLSECGLTSLTLDGVPCVAEADTVLVCKKLYEDDIRESNFLDKSLLSNYALKDYHRFYVCEIKQAYKRI